MKTSKTKSATFHARLAAYSATAAAAVLATPEANATIKNLYSGTVTLAVQHTNVRQIDRVSFGPSGSFDINLFEQGNNSSISHGAVVGVLGNPPSGQIFGSGAAHRFAVGNVINSATQQARGIAATLFTNPGGSTHYGNFVPPINGAATGYIGFKTIQNAKTYYGWMRVQVTANAGNQLTAISLLSVDGIVGAYDLEGNGLTAGEINATPEPGTVAIGGLGLLALGVRGVRELRRRRAATSLNQNN